MIISLAAENSGGALLMSPCQPLGGLIQTTAGSGSHTHPLGPNQSPCPLDTYLGMATRPLSRCPLTRTGSTAGRRAMALFPLWRPRRTETSGTCNSLGGLGVGLIAADVRFALNVPNRRLDKRGYPFE